MSHAQSTFRRWFLLPAILVGFHTLLVVAVLAAGGFVADRSGHEGIDGHVYILFSILDYPGSWLLWRQSILGPFVFFLCSGIIHWGVIGLVIQASWRWSRTRMTDA